jgi:kynurenine 3-monooxygenase
LYSQVTFSNIRYSVAYKQGQVQSKIMDEVLEMENIEAKWDSDEVMNKILSLCK